MEQEKSTLDVEKVWKEYEACLAFNRQIDLYDTVENNENFFIGKQWEGVQANGLPTPVFNFIKRIILYLVASTSTDHVKMSASPLSSTGMVGRGEVERLCSIVNAQFEALFERNKVGKLLREFMRNAAVDGDGCLYSYFDPSIETGQAAKGGIRVELVENTRVFFGNPNNRNVQEQPYLFISRRERVEDVRRKAKGRGVEEEILPDSDDAQDRFDKLTDGKVTVLTRFWRDEETGTIHAMELTRKAVVRPAWDLEQKLYPVVWMPWEYVMGCYHGQAAVTGLIPNQIFVNKTFAMSMISLMTTAYPKVVYDKTRIANWSNGVGQAIGITGGDVNTVAKTLSPATISPQISQFIELAINLTKEFMGATDAALGDTRPDNTSAIIALQKASSVPMELTKQNLFQCVEDLGYIWQDIMRCYYGQRYVEVKPTEAEGQAAELAGVPVDDAPRLFDFGALEEVPMSIQLDVGGSAYWSEIAQMNTLDNLLMQGKITVIDYLERVPNGYISNQQELIDTLKERMGQVQPPGAGDGGPLLDANLPEAIPVGGGLGELQKALNETGMA